jgi:hypothetical protein
MKIWLDDLRPAPDDSWTWVKTSAEALSLLRDYYAADVGLAPINSDPITVMSFDHDLGGNDTSRPVMMWLAEYGGDRWPDAVLVHSMNPIGQEYLIGVATQFAPDYVKIGVTNLHKG